MIVTWVCRPDPVAKGNGLDVVDLGESILAVSTRPESLQDPLDLFRGTMASYVQPEDALIRPVQQDGLIKRLPNIHRIP